MRRLLALASVLLPLVALTACEAGPGQGEAVPAPAAPPPNLLLISVDTLNRSALRAFDPMAPELPALDALAARSARFQAALSTASWTLPAHASLLTGLYPQRHGATDWRLRLPDSLPTIAEALRERGYTTIGLTGGGFVGADFGLDRGFDRFEEERVEGRPRSGAENADGERPEADPFARATRFLRRNAAQQLPFFLFVHTYTVHDYYRARGWTVQRLPPYDDRDPDEYLDCLLGAVSCTADEWRRLEALYRAELAHLDYGLGRLLDALADSGLAGSTHVVLVSDHGEGFEPARGRIHHGGRLHADQLRVPFLWSGPGVAARDVPDPVSLVDVAPTLLDLAGAGGSDGSDSSDSSDTAAGLDGAPLAEILRRPTAALPARQLFASTHQYGWQGGHRFETDGPRDRPLQAALIDDQRWWILSADGNELYDWRDDLAQHHDRGEEQEPSEDLEAALRPHLAPLAVKEPRSDDPQVEEELRALGYLR